MADPRVGVDVGGTFTDVVAVRDGELSVTKVPSTPAAPADGVLDGLDAMAETAGVAPDAVGFLAHGTTVATNAVLEREWAETALVTNEGFRDVLEIGRQDRPALYDLTATKPEPVVPRDRRFEVPGRLDERGRELEPVDEEAVQAVAGAIEDTAAETVAVSLLFAFEDEAHERRVAELLEAATGLDVSRSSTVLPALREYERMLATALNAALVPVMGAYLGGLGPRIDERGFATELAVMQSNGGTIAAERAAAEPVRTLLSGPAAGVRGAAYVAETAGEPDVLTLDMGGTSCDVSLVRDGEPTVSREVTVGDYPVRLPMVDVHTIGAGGGSIAWLDEGGALRVGPRSAGADPGPICYGRGGTEPTVTDAQSLLGRLDASRFAAGALDVDRATVEDRFAEQLAEPLGQSVEAASRGVLEVANASMERALRVVSVERGIDPRELGLVAFGGAGGLHATALAAGLGIPRVLVPRAAGVLSALGLLVGDVVEDLSTSRVRPWAAGCRPSAGATSARSESATPGRPTSSPCPSTTRWTPHRSRRSRSASTSDTPSGTATPPPASRSSWSPSACGPGASSSRRRSRRPAAARWPRPPSSAAPSSTTMAPARRRSTSATASRWQSRWPARPWSPRRRPPSCSGPMTSPAWTTPAPSSWRWAEWTRSPSRSSATRSRPSPRR